MDRGLNLRSLGKFLYTQNPFYLISCFLIIYGLQIATTARGDLVSRSAWLAIGTAAYTALMAVTCIGVVRLGKVWQDARSIFLVVAISFVAFSVGIDELCVVDWNLAAAIMAGGGLMTVVTTEVVLRACRLRLPSWYRLSFYGLMLVFFASPLVLGRAVAERQTQLSNWGPMLFSVAVAVAIGLLAPAIRRGGEAVRDNGSPWRYPLYPLSLFAVLVVLAGIRAHAIWISFGFIGAAVRFEFLLLAPILLAVLGLMIESPYQRSAAMALAPLLMLGAVTPGGTSHLPMIGDVRDAFGSAGTFCGFAIAAFYTYAWIRRTAAAPVGLVATMLGLGCFGTIPEAAFELGVRTWMFGGVACVITGWICLRQRRADYVWMALGFLVSVTMAMAGNAYDASATGWLSAAGCSVASMMLIGLAFDTDLARFLRLVSALGLVVGTIAGCGWFVIHGGDRRLLAILAAGIGVSLGYSVLVGRRGWWYVGAVQALMLAGLLAFDGYRRQVFRGVNLPITSGLACFVVGITITSAKTGVGRRWMVNRTDDDAEPRFERGF